MSLTTIQEFGTQLVDLNSAFYLQSVPPFGAQFYRLLGSLVPAISLSQVVLNTLFYYLYVFFYYRLSDPAPQMTRFTIESSFETDAGQLLNERFNQLATSDYTWVLLWSMIEELIAEMFYYAALYSYKFFALGFGASPFEMGAILFLNLYPSVTTFESFIDSATVQKIVFAIASIKLVSALGCFVNLVQVNVWANQGKGISTSILDHAILIEIFQAYIPHFFAATLPSLATAAYYVYI